MLNLPKARHGLVCKFSDVSNDFQAHLIAHGVEIIPDQQQISGYNRFYLRDPGGNRIEIAEFTKD